VIRKEDAMEIREAGERDVPALLDIQRAAFARYVGELRAEQIPPLKETAEEMKDDLRSRGFLVAIVEGQPAGSVRFFIRAGVCILERLSVEPGFQGRGVGRMLVNEVERRARGSAHKVYLETGLLAGDLIRFYTKLGYAPEAVLRRHYGDFDWIAFSRFLA